MHRRKRFRFVFLGIAAIALVMALSGNAQHGAWMQGYASGIAAAGGDAAAMAPMMAHHGMHGGFGIIGAIIGGIFRLGLFLLMFAFIMKMFGFMMWRMSGRAGGPPWANGGRQRWACAPTNHLDSGDAPDFANWNRDEWRQKWQEKKRAWAQEAGFGSDSDEASHDDRPAEERPAEERFVV